MSGAGIQLTITGQVQGVGFRPFIWQLANEFQLCGEVYNNAQGVVIKVHKTHQMSAFIEAIQKRAPRLAYISDISQKTITTANYHTFTIAHSCLGEMHTQIPADVATCQDCLTELNTPTDRRYHYALNNCIHCGPRYSIIERMPYDRSATTMADFAMCEPCATQYRDPQNRRFHAQPIACNKCGPTLSLLNNSGEIITQDAQACIDECVTQLKQGKIVAIKGVGGFHLAVDATNTEAVNRLRLKKHRPHKPFAIMARDISAIQGIAFADETERAQLQSPAAPIVLLRQNKNQSNTELAHNIANNIAHNINLDMPFIGVMLANAPMQHLLASRMHSPLVMTSANLSGCSPVIDNVQAIEQLGSICDCILTHNRSILRRLDDSLVQVIDGKPSIMRRARGYVPHMLDLPKGFELCDSVTAFGADIKNAPCFIKQGKALLLPHLGDVSNPAILDELSRSLTDNQQLFAHQNQLIVADKHAGYVTHQQAKILANSENLQLVNHHHAHIAACLADNGIAREHPPVLALVLDGLGWHDGSHSQATHSLFGGELFIADYQHCQHLRGLPATPLIGGDKAATEPWRNLFAQLECHVDDWQAQAQENRQGKPCALSQLQQQPIALLRSAIQNNLNTPLASSAGRLFDAVSALVSDCFAEQSFEGQAAMKLEALAWHDFTENSLDLSDFKRSYPSPNIKQMWQQIMSLYAHQTPSAIALFFHRYLAHLLLFWLRQAQVQVRSNKVALSGGVMQNALLTRLLVHGLQQQQQVPLCHHKVPCNDGGISLGQALVAWTQLQERT